MKVWVTGAKGLLGSTLCKASSFCVPSSREEADIADIASLRRFVQDNPGITHIVNCAAYSLVDLAETHRSEAHLINAAGPQNLAKIAHEIQARFIHISTDYVFPGDLFRPLSEEDKAGPINYYGETKWEGEQRLLDCLPSACIIRTSFIFGSRGKNFVSRLLELLFQREEIHLAEDSYNRPTLAEDLSLAILRMLDKSGIYHFANQGMASKFSFGSAMRDLAIEMGLPVVTKRIVPVPNSFFLSSCKRPVYSVLDTAKIEKLLPIRSWQEALYAFLQGYVCGASVLF